jgi:hypothetical protein
MRLLPSRPAACGSTRTGLWLDARVDSVSLPSSLSRAVFGRRIGDYHESSFFGSIRRAQVLALNSNRLHPQPNELPVELSRGCANSHFHRKVRFKKRVGNAFGCQRAGAVGDG